MNETQLLYDIPWFGGSAVMLKLFLWHPIGFPFFMVGFIPLSFPSYPLVNIHSLRTGSHGQVEIVDLPIQNGDFPSFFVCLPEGNSSQVAISWVKSPRV